MNVKEIQLAIHKLTSMEELKEVNEALKLQWRHVQTLQAHSFRKGQKVSFTGRGGRLVQGTVEKVNQKTVSVSAGLQTWRVSPGLLKKVG